MMAYDGQRAGALGGRAVEQGDEADERLPELRSGTGRFRALALAAYPRCSADME
jgi:hypothetical protein